MNSRRSLLLLSVALVLTIAANCWMDYRTSGTNRLVSLRTMVDATREIDRIEFARPGKSTLTLIKTDEWHMIKPFGAEVDQAVVYELLDRLVGEPIGDSLSTLDLRRMGRSLADYGLAEPALSVTLGDASGAINWMFGNETPQTNEVYAAISNLNRICSIPMVLYRKLDVSTETFRNRRVMGMPSAAIVNIELQPADGKRVTLKSEGLEWKCGVRTMPAKAVAEISAAFADAEVMRFIWPVGTTNEPGTASQAILGGCGLDNETACTCVFKSADGEECRLLLGAANGEDEVYALIQHGRSIVTVSASLKKAFYQGVSLASDPRIFPYERAEVKSIGLIQGNFECSLAREAEGGWRIDKPVSARADEKFVEAMLDRLLASTTEKVVKGKDVVAVSIGNDTFTLSHEEVFGAANFEALRSREMLQVNPAHVKRVVVACGQQKVSVAVNRETGVWKYESPVADGNAETKKVDDAAMNELLAIMNPLKAVKVAKLHVAPEELSWFGLEKPWATVAIDQDRDDVLRRNVLIGAKTDGGRFATIGSLDAIFVMSEENLETLMRLMEE